MAPHKTLPKINTSASNSNVSFSARGPEGVNVEHIICTPKYVTMDELKKPAVVTDRLRRDYEDLKIYDRLSMKGGVRTILRMDDVAQTVHAYWNTDSNNSNNSADSNDEDSLVSVIS